MISFCRTVLNDQALPIDHRSRVAFALALSTQTQQSHWNLQMGVWLEIANMLETIKHQLIWSDLRLILTNQNNNFKKYLI